MSTDASFTPASTPECAYEPEMTLAEALARQAAGTLDPNCVVVITDGPIIGTPGNTSPTIIELNPVAPNDLGMSARVRTNFNTAAWDAIYDPHLGPAGSIQRLTDEWNNVAQDSDLNAPTVHTQVPWHKGSNTFRDNFFDDCTLPGWDAAGGDIRDNVLQETTVDLTGKTSGVFRRNQIIGGTFAASTPTSNIENNSLNNATVSVAQSAGTFAFRNNTLLTGTLTVDAATTVSVNTISNNVFGGPSGGFRLDVLGKTGTICTIAGNRMFNQSDQAYDLRVSGSGNLTVYSNEIGGSAILINSSGHVEIGANTITASQVGHGAVSDVKMLRTVTIGSGLNLSGTSVVDGGRLMKTTVVTGGFNLDTFDILGGTYTLTANNVNVAAGPGFNNLT